MLNGEMVFPVLEHMATHPSFNKNTFYDKVKSLVK
jgi:hypothetical protein